MKSFQPSCVNSSLCRTFGFQCALAFFSIQQNNIKFSFVVGLLRFSAQLPLFCAVTAHGSPIYSQRAGKKFQRMALNLAKLTHYFHLLLLLLLLVPIERRYFSGTKIQSMPLCTPELLCVCVSWLLDDVGIFLCRQPWKRGACVVCFSASVYVQTVFLYWLWLRNRSTQLPKLIMKLDLHIGFVLSVISTWIKLISCGSLFNRHLEFAIVSFYAEINCTLKQPTHGVMQCA